MCVHACGVNIHTSAAAACSFGRHCRCGLQRRRRPLRRACGRRRGGKLRATAVGRSILLPPAAASAAALVAGSQRSPCGADGAALHRLGVEERARLARPLLSPPPPSQRSAATLLPTPHARSRGPGDVRKWGGEGRQPSGGLRRTRTRTVTTTAARLLRRRPSPPWPLSGAPPHSTVVAPEGASVRSTVLGSCVRRERMAHVGGDAAGVTSRSRAPLMPMCWGGLQRAMFDCRSPVSLCSGGCSLARSCSSCIQKNGRNNRGAVVRPHHTRRPPPVSALRSTRARRRVGLSTAPVVDRRWSCGGG